MAATPQSQSLQTANQLLSLSAQVMGIYQQLQTLDASWSDNATATTIAAMTTTTLAADGGPGAADATPNVAHPISTTVYPALGRAVSSNQLVQMKTILDGIVAYVNGQAVTTQPGARAILNVAVGG